MIPAMNWQTPPKKIKTPIRTFGVATPLTWTPKMEIKKIPVKRLEIIPEINCNNEIEHSIRKGTCQ